MDDCEGCTRGNAFLIGRHRRLIRLRDPSHKAFFDVKPAARAKPAAKGKRGR